MVRSRSGWASAREPGPPRPSRQSPGGTEEGTGARPASTTRGVQRRAVGLAFAVLCLLLATRVSAVVYGYQYAQLPFTVALFVIPLAYTRPGWRRQLQHHRWMLLAAQSVLTWVPLVAFGSHWQDGIAGLLAGLVLLSVPGRRSWLLAGLLLIADATVRAAVTGLLLAPTWYGALDEVTRYVMDALTLFGIVRLASIVGEAEDRRAKAAGLAVASELLRAAEVLQSAVGRRLVDVAGKVARARQALSTDPAETRTLVDAAGVRAREAGALARDMAAGWGDPPDPGVAPRQIPGAALGARLAWVVLVAMLGLYSALDIGYAVSLHYGARPMAWAAVCILGAAALQLYHWGARGHDRPRAWQLTLALQAVLVYAYWFPFVRSYVGSLFPFLAGSVLLLVRGRGRWAGYAAIVVSSSVLVLAPDGVAPLWAADALHQLPAAIFTLAGAALTGLVVYGLGRLVGQARELEVVRGQQALAASVQQRLRVARDIHDLLGLGLSAVALKADLASELIGNDDARAAVELDEMDHICAATLADLWQVTALDKELALEEELAAVSRLLTSAGVDVSVQFDAGALPPAADEVLSPVLREAVTNVLRHSNATNCSIVLTRSDSGLRLSITNDGAMDVSTKRRSSGTGLANLRSRVQSVGGALTSRLSGRSFALTADVPLPLPGGEPPTPGARRIAAPVRAAMDGRGGHEAAALPISQDDSALTGPRAV
jgi:two-component system sensor histidine kinase DesK